MLRYVLNPAQDHFHRNTRFALKCRYFINSMQAQTKLFKMSMCWYVYLFENVHRTKHGRINDLIYNN